MLKTVDYFRDKGEKSKKALLTKVQQKRRNRAGPVFHDCRENR